MKVVHIYKDYHPVVGGIENHVRLLAESQAASGMDVTVLVTSQSVRSSVSVERGVRVIRASRLATVASTPISLMLPLRLARIKADIAHLHFPYPVGEISQLLAGRSRHMVISYHSDVVRQKTILRFYYPTMQRVLQRADRILVSTSNYLDSSATLAPFRAKCLIVPYGIDQSRFQALSPEDPAVQNLRQRLAARPILLFVGVLRYYKGLCYLIEAMRRLRATLVIVGRGPMLQPLRQQVCDLGVDRQVVFAGAVPDEQLAAYYAAADLFVLPACERSEAFGLVQVEALATGLPIVSTELGTGTSYVNAHGESGLVVPPRDSELLAEAIARLLADDALRARLARGARARAALFTADRMVQEIQAVYDDLLAEQ